VNAINAFIFMTMGSAMGLLPLLFPAWFPPTGADASCARALWLEVMAATQIALGLGYIIQARVLPFAARLISVIRASDSGALALSKTRGVPGR
jgi:hypothetical protein